MAKQIIIEVKGLIIKVPKSILDKMPFDLEFGTSYMLQFNAGGGKLHVTNGVNGYGENVKKEFENEIVTIYLPVNLEV